MAFRLKNSKRNWARSSTTTMAGDDNVPSVTKAGKVMLAGMAVATAVGLAFITSPWWMPSSQPVLTTDSTPRLGNLRGHGLYHQRFHNGRIANRAV